MKLALLISGSGTTASAVIKACQPGSHLFLTGIEPVCVIASSDQIAGIQNVIDAGMNEKNIYVISPKDFKHSNNLSKEFGSKILQVCEKHKVDLIGQYGWLCKTPANVVVAYEKRIINQHPGPLDPGHPDFGGKGMYGKRVIFARLLFVRELKKDFWTEATAHRVTAEYDQGAVIGRVRVTIEPDDTVESLYKQMLPVEHKLQIKILQDFANGCVTELQRETPLVLSDEEQILETAKQKAIEAYS